MAMCPECFTLAQLVLKHKIKVYIFSFLLYFFSHVVISSPFQTESEGPYQCLIKVHVIFLHVEEQEVSLSTEFPGDPE